MGVSKLSNSFATGGGGNNFEQRIQAMFLLFLLKKGFLPILGQSVVQLDFQSKHRGDDVDDLIIIGGGKDSPKILCQIKHDIIVSKNSKLFQEVINAAWSDFQKDSFHRERDKIVLATGIIAKDSIFALRYIHEQAIYELSADAFLMRIQQSIFTSDRVREKFYALEIALKTANGGVGIGSESLWQFCKVFILLVFDLEFESSVNRMLVASLINCQCKEDSRNVYSRLYEFAGECNQAGGCISLENFPDDIKEWFNIEKTAQLHAEGEDPISPSELWVELALIGGWDERNENDIRIVEEIVGLGYEQLRHDLIKLVSSHGTYITCEGRVWKLHNRTNILRECENYFSDQVIERAFLSAKEMLVQINRRLNGDGEFSIMIPEKGEFENSNLLRRELTNGLCILTNNGFNLAMCSRNITKRCSFGLFRDIFEDCNWKRVASLHDVLPLMAEINPRQYLAKLEQYIKAEANLIYLFPKDNEDPLFTRTFIYGIIWSLETLAWDERYLVACVRCLGMIAQKVIINDKCLTIVIDAIRTILRPLHPQTMALPQKQKNSIQALRTEMPEIGWMAIKGLLPKSGVITTETPKPKYMCKDFISKEVESETVEELFRYYCSIALELAAGNSERLEELIDNIEYMDDDYLEIYLFGISETSGQWNDEERFPLWNRLSEMKYRILHEQSDAAPPESALYQKLLETIDTLAPHALPVLYRRLYLTRYDEFSLYSNYREAWNSREKAKREAVFDIYNTFGLREVQEFGVQVDNLRDVGYKLGQYIPVDDMQNVFHAYINHEVQEVFLSSMMGGIVDANGIDILTSLNLEEYEGNFISDILSYFYLSDNLIKLAGKLLPNNEDSMWKKVKIPLALENDGNLDIRYAVNQLVKIGRTTAAVNLCGNVYGDLPVSDKELISILKKAAVSENEERLDRTAVQSLVERLQKRQEPDIGELSEVELIYLPWLDETSPVSPKALICRLANDADFFCELLRVYYKKRHEEKPEKGLPKLNKAWTERLFRIFHLFRAVPGTDWNGSFHGEVFMWWFEKVRAWSVENDRYEVAMLTLGNGLSFAPVDEDGLLCSQVICNVLDSPDGNKIREGYSLGVFNQRGAYWVDPEGKAERRLAAKYVSAAEKAEGYGYSRYAELLRDIGERYLHEAEWNALAARE